MEENKALDEARTERMRRTVIKIAYWGLIILAVILFGKYLLPVLFPFILAYLLAWAIDRPVTWIRRKTKLPRAVTATLFVLAIIFGLSGILTLAGSWIFSWIRDAFSILPKVFSEGIFPAIEYMFNDLEQWVAGISPEVADQYCLYCLSV